MYLFSPINKLKAIPANWPSNFCIAFWVEMLIAQPIARFAMKKLQCITRSLEESISRRHISKGTKRSKKKKQRNIKLHQLKATG